MIKFGLILSLSLLATACLKTRNEVDDEEKVMQSQVNQLQKNKADQDANLQNYDSLIRTLNGRVETLEHQVSQLNSEKEELTRKLSEHGERFKQVEQALLQIEQGQSVALRPAPSKALEDEPKKADTKKHSLYDEAEDLYAQKQWKKAVVLYQKYRDKNPSGPDVAAATYKMGNCFQEMKMNKEAKVFYEEVVEKHPKSKYSKLALARLSQLKKK